MAEQIAGLDLVVFVDATVTESPEPLAIIAVAPVWKPHATAHHLAPADLLALAESLYGKKPRAVLVKIRGHDFHFGSTLSPETRASVDEATRRIRHLLAT